MPSRNAVVSVFIRNHFLADHRRLEDLFDRLLAALRTDDREQIASVWTEFDVGLAAHLEAEEKYLIPELARSSERDAQAILAEHARIRTRLAELDTQVDLHMVRLESARQFIQQLRDHARHEDRMLYRWADEHVDETLRAKLLEALSRRPRRRRRAHRLRNGARGAP